MRISPSCAGASSHALVTPATPLLDDMLNVGWREEDAVLIMSRSGPVFSGMADKLWAAFALCRCRHGIATVMLAIDSPGGSIVEGERVIHVLKQQTRDLNLDRVEAGCSRLPVRSAKNIIKPAEKEN
jgi:hypothetical protein